MKKIIFSFIALFLFAAAGFSQIPKIEFEKYELPNGLKVILHEDHTTPIVAVTVTYHVGSKNEFSDRTGFAHFFEHLMFEGSEYINRGEFMQIVQNAGGQLNASTSFDQTNYFLLLPSNQLELGLWMESERMLHLKIDSLGVETQRSVVKEERKQSIDNRPYGSLMEQVFSHAYTKHPYRWTPIGSAQYIDQATIDEFISFYKHFYVPNNAVLSIAGDVTIDQAKSLVEKYFSSIPRGTGEVRRPTEIEPVQTAEVRDTVYDNIQLPAVIHAYHVPAQGTPDAYALEMVAKIFSTGESSRLNTVLVEQKQIAIQAGSFSISLENPGLFIVYAITQVGAAPDSVESVMDAEIAKMQNELISEEEFTKLRNQIESEFIGDKARMLSIANSLATYELFFGDANLINTELERSMKVTREDIQRVAREYLKKENRVVLYYLPKQTESTNN